MSDIGFSTILVIAFVGMIIAIFGVFPTKQFDFPEHEDPPEESE